MTFSKPSKILFVGEENPLLKILGKENETEVISSMIFMETIVSYFIPDLIIFSSYKDADISEIRKNPSLLGVPVLILGKDFSDLNNLNSITEFPRVMLCNTFCTEMEPFVEHIKQILKKNISMQNPKTSRIIKYTVLFLNKNFRKKLSRKDIAEHLGVAQDYLTRIFKKETGLGLWDYLIELKLNEARQILLQTGTPVKEIALSLGFTTDAYFVNTFHKRYGIAPGELRNK